MGRVSPMSLPKPSEPAKAAFAQLLPKDPAVTTRPMFGNVSGFVNGNMFCGLFGDDFIVRVPETDQTKIRKQGGKPFEPMPGRAMTGYMMLAPGWQKKMDATRDWVMVALAWTRKLPPKSAQKKPASPKAARKR